MEQKPTAGHTHYTEWSCGMIEGDKREQWIEQSVETEGGLEQRSSLRSSLEAFLHSVSLNLGWEDECWHCTLQGRPQLAYPARGAKILTLYGAMMQFHSFHNAHFKIVSSFHNVHPANTQTMHKKRLICIRWNHERSGVQRLYWCTHSYIIYISALNVPDEFYFLLQDIWIILLKIHANVLSCNVKENEKEILDPQLHVMGSISD